MQPEINSPFRGWKATLFEGGLRVPLLMQWPGVLPSGRVLAAPVSHVDLFPTLLAAADLFAQEEDRVQIPLVNPLSGVNLLPALILETPAATVGDAAAAGLLEELLLNRPIFWRSGHYKAIRRGSWKLQKSDNPKKMWLYNLDTDPHEWENLAAVEPFSTEVLPSLLAALMEEDAKQRTPLWPSLTETAILIDKLFETNETLADEYIYWPN